MATERTGTGAPPPGRLRPGPAEGLRAGTGPAAARRGRGRRPRQGAGPGPRRRPGGRWTAAFLALAGLAIVAAAAWALLGSSLLAVRSVAVTGSPAVPRAEVLRAAAIRLGTPLVRVDTAAVARRVEQIAEVQSAQVSRHWPDSVVISVQARTPALALPAGGGFDLIDRFGVVVTHVARRPPGMVLLVTTAAPASLRGSPAVRAAVIVLGQLPPRIRGLVRAVAAPSPDAVTLDLRGGATVLWGGTDRAAAKARELEILMRTGASSYDLSDPGTAVTGG
jgi:cell division protein FtsQ